MSGNSPSRPRSTGDLLARGMARHQAGQFAEAEAMYGEVLRAEPSQPDALHLLGLLAYQTGRAEAAVSLLERAALANPESASFHYDLGVVLASQGRLAEAIERYRRALSLNPTYFEALCNLGGLLATAGRAEEAIDCYRRAVTLQPGHVESHFYLGILLAQLGRLEEAARAYQAAIAAQPSYVGAHNNLGNTLWALGRFDEAEASYRRALALQPDLAALHNNLGDLFCDQGKYDAAAAEYERALALEPESAQALSNLGSVLTNLRRFEEAERCCRRALEIRPDDVQAHVHLGNVFKAQGELQRAEASYRRALALDPEHADALISLGGALALQGAVEEALSCFQQALSRRPDSAEAHMGLAMLLLLRGELSRGWAEYEWRWRWKQFTTPRWHSAQPAWDGAALEGKTILVHAEQGYGDTLQFLRFLPAVAARGGRVILACQPALAPLLREVEGAERVAITERDLPDYAVYAPLMSLPYLLEAGGAGELVQDALHRKQPYVHADDELVAQWRHELAPYRGLRVGLVWAGSPTNSNDRNRSTTLATLGALGQAGVHFFALQKGEAGQEARTPPAEMDLIDLGPRLASFADTAAVVAQLDVVVAVDTAVAHLAGAMGAPVWVLLSAVADWRWQLEREDSPWYPSARLFRQERPGDWAPVLRRVATALATLRDARQA